MLGVIESLVTGIARDPIALARIVAVGIGVLLAFRLAAGLARLLSSIAAALLVMFALAALVFGHPQRISHLRELREEAVDAARDLIH